MSKNTGIQPIDLSSVKNGIVGNDKKKKEESKAPKTGGVGKSDVIVPPSEDETRLLTAPSWAWAIILTLWFIGGIILLKYSLLALLGYIAMFIAWLISIFQTVKENERAKPVFLGQIGKLVGSGPMFVLKPLEKLVRYPTGVQQIAFATAGILTKREGEKTPIVLPVDPVLNFQWPWKDEELTLAVRNAPPPTKEGLEELVNQLEEPFLDLVRTVGGQKSYEWIAQNRVDFAEGVTEQLWESKDLTGLIKLFQLKNPVVSMKHIEIPKPVKDALEAEASALYEGRAAGAKERETRIGIAEGERVKREKIFTVIREYKDIGLNVEALITLREMAQTGKTTHFVLPSEVYGALTRALGAPAEQAIAGMSKKDFEKLIEKLKKLGE